MFSRAALRALPLLASFVLSPMAQAASTIRVQWSDLSLSITDASGHVTAHDDFLATGDSSSQSSLMLAYGDPAQFDGNLLVGAKPMPSLRTDTIEQQLGATKVAQSLTTSPQGQASLTTELASLASLAAQARPSQGNVSDFLMAGGLAPAFFGVATTDPAFDVMSAPVHGGIWVAAGDTITLTGKLTSSITLDPGDFAQTSTPFSADVLAGGAVVFGLVKDGSNLSESTISDPSGSTASEVMFDSNLSANAPLSDTHADLIVSSLTNTSSEGRWLVFGLGSLIHVGLTSATPTGGGGLIPEPATHALMGLGLVGVALAARRQRARNG